MTFDVNIHGCCFLLSAMGAQGCTGHPIWGGEVNWCWQKMHWFCRFFNKIRAKRQNEHDNASMGQIFFIFIEFLLKTTGIRLDLLEILTLNNKM